MSRTEKFHREGAETRSRTQRISLRLCVFAVIFLSMISVNAQTKKLTEFPITGVSKVSIDRLGNFYLLTQDNKLRKYDTDGKFMVETGLSDSVNVTLIETWNPLRIFIYNSKKQEALMLDRFLAPLDKTTLDPSIAIEPALASPIPNNSIWVFDKADLSLKKTDPAATHVIMEISLQLPPGSKPEYTFLREYQNQLFLIDKLSGVQMFSIVGKQIRSFQVSNLNYLGFLGEEIYYLENGKVKFYDLYDEKQHELAVDPTARYVLVTDERMILVKSATVEVWEYKP